MNILLFSESDPTHPTEGSILKLRNKNTGNSLNCYMKTLNIIIDNVPEGFQRLDGWAAVGPDEKFFQTDLTTYKETNKIVMIGQRYKNKKSLMVQMMFDKEHTGNFAYSKKSVQFSSEDALEALRNFGHTMTEKHLEYINQQKIVKELNDQIPDEKLE